MLLLFNPHSLLQGLCRHSFNCEEFYSEAITFQSSRLIHAETWLLNFIVIFSVQPLDKEKVMKPPEILVT